MYKPIFLTLSLSTFLFCSPSMASTSEELLIDDLRIERDNTAVHSMSFYDTDLSDIHLELQNPYPLGTFKDEVQHPC